MSSSERESELAAENVRLKRQLAEQAEELAILQKAATYFAKRLNFSIFKLSPARHSVTRASRLTAASG